MINFFPAAPTSCASPSSQPRRTQRSRLQSQTPHRSLGDHDGGDGGGDGDGDGDGDGGDDRDDDDVDDAIDDAGDDRSSNGSDCNNTACAMPMSMAWVFLTRDLWRLPHHDYADVSHRTCRGMRLPSHAYPRKKMSIRSCNLLLLPLPKADAQAYTKA